MAYSNDMTLLLNKCERRLGLKPLNLPKELSKDEWATVIEQDTLPTFSRYFPLKMPYTFTQADRKGDWYLIDEDKIGNIKIIGIRDILFSNFSNNTSFLNTQGYAAYDMLYPTNLFDLDTFSTLQTAADSLSLFNCNIFIEFEPPNKVKIVNSANLDVVRQMPQFNIEIFIQHSSLLTISATKMETVEALAQADIASFLYNQLKYYENLETVFANANLKLDDLQNEATKREQIVQDLKDGYISAGNDNQPMMFTI